MTSPPREGPFNVPHELLVPIAIDHQLDECGCTSRRGSGVLCCASSGASLRDLAVLFSILR
jgi:hypothetical protein